MVHKVSAICDVHSSKVLLWRLNPLAFHAGLAQKLDEVCQGNWRKQRDVNKR